MKKIFFLLASGLLSGSGLRAQTSGWETGINLSGGASDYVFTDVPADQKSVAANDKQHFMKPKFYYSAGVYGRKFFKKMYGIEVGLQYTSFAQGTKKLEIKESDFLFSDNAGGKVWLNIRHGYVEMPVRFVFKKELGTVFSIGCFAGVSPAVLVTSMLQIGQVSPDGKWRSMYKENLNMGYGRRFTLFADAGLLLRADISSHFALDLNPFFRMSALPIHNDKVQPIAGAVAVKQQQHYIAGGATVSTVWKF